PALPPSKIVRVADGYSVRYGVRCPEGFCLPAQIGIVFSETDTTYNVLNCQCGLRSVGSIAYEIVYKEKPLMVILDPNYYLPDINRQNNYYSEPAGEYEYQMPENVFPALKPF
ncbi:MAG: hypothetical protein KAU36_03105, partial [candidate division Zixibacteria bacterium]|nr:hypothetical protein [candidate division Zixibacteria bacterium]